jgi:arylsulfatase A-like enzyme
MRRAVTDLSGRPPNILLIGVDSLRADHLGCYGYPRATSPHIDRLAAEGTLFEQYWSPHIPTTPGYGSMLTGKDCFSTGLVGLRQREFAPNVKTLAELLEVAGYATTCVGFPGNAASRGFQSYFDYKAWGNLDEAPLRKAEGLNEVFQPELDRLIDDGEPWFALLRHMDPHAPYLPPSPYDRLFYWGDECDPANNSMAPVMSFAPFRDFFASWMPPGISDAEFVKASYDGAIAYMDACIGRLLYQLEARGVAGETIIALTADHGETLYDHDCFFDHHGLYDCTLHVPLILRYRGRVPAGRRIKGTGRHADLLPTLLELAGLAEAIPDDLTGSSLLDLVNGLAFTHDDELYLTEATWMRKHGWRTPDWKLIVALEPDFHFKPEVELYDLRSDPGEDVNVAHLRPDVVADLRNRMDVHIAERTKATGRPAPIEILLDWHGKTGRGAFATSQEAYDTMHIGDPEAGRRLQAGGPPEATEKRGARPASKPSEKAATRIASKSAAKSASSSAAPASRSSSRPGPRSSASVAGGQGATKKVTASKRATATKKTTATSAKTGARSKRT